MHARSIARERRLLVINPNTSSSITDLLCRHISAQLGTSMAVHGVTAHFGAPYISSESTYVVGAHAVLDIWQTTAAGAYGIPDAVLIGCFGDPGLHALRDACTVPVSGLAEAAFSVAARSGRFAIVTGGKAWEPMLQRLALSLGYSPLLAGICTITATGSQLAADPVAAHTLLTDACLEASKLDGVKAIILGGAGLAGMAATIGPSFHLPIIDSVTAGALWAMGAISYT